VKKEDLKKMFASKINGDLSNLSVWEHGTDVNLQLEYVEYIIKHPDQIEIDDIGASINELHTETTETETRKRILTALSLKSDVAAYRALEKFVEQTEDELHEWAKIAYQYSRVMVEAELSDEPRVLISSGLGGKGTNLRYFAIFRVPDKSEITEFQKSILTKELEFAAVTEEGEIESIVFYDYFVTVNVLLMFKKDIRRFLVDVIKNTNELGGKFDEDIVITNARYYSEEEIRKLIEDDESEDDDDFDDELPEELRPRSKE